MKVPVSENPRSGKAGNQPDFPKTSVNLDYLCSRFPAIERDFALVSALSCLSALKSPRKTICARLRPIVKFHVQPKYTTIKLSAKCLT